jgi:peptidoglycan lytic transglycosylase G
MRISAFVASVALSFTSTFAVAQDANYPFTITALSCEQAGSITIVEIQGEPPVLLGAPEIIVQRSAVGFVLQYQTVWEGVPLVQNSFLESRDRQWTFVTAIGGQQQKDTCFDASATVEGLLPVVEEYTQRANLKLLSELQAQLGAMTLMAQELRAKRIEIEAELVDARESAFLLELWEQHEREMASDQIAEIIFQIRMNQISTIVRTWDAKNGFVQVAEFNLLNDELPEIYLEKLDDGDVDFRVVVAEGVTSWQVVEALNGINILSGPIKILPDEGTLAPSNYKISRGMERSKLVSMMQALQGYRLEAAWASRSRNLPLNDPDELLILASIIEKETVVPQEKRQIASVFVNRLKNGMRLQADPTVIYGITRGERVLGRELKRSELRRETPWNTYVIDGLPPTPIASPATASLLAAAQPDPADYFFFVADGAGGHVFAKTLSEHNANVARWRQIEAANATTIEVATSGAQLSNGEKESLGVAVSSCWNVGSLSLEALQTTVSVSVAMNADGTPIVGSISLAASSGGSPGAARQAFEAARRAIIRCGAHGFDLPEDKFGQWQKLEMTFAPERMSVSVP